MKKQLLLLITLMSFFIMPAQSIGIIGSATPTGWGSDTDLATTDNITYTITMTFVSGEAKFRQDDAWTVNWGSLAFPTGTGTQDGQNIQVPAGTYTVTFNRITGDYNFSGMSTFANIGIWGPAVDAINGFAGPDVDMMTTDGITYTLSGYNFTSGTAKFRKNDDGSLSYGSTGFPTGTAVLNGSTFYVPGGQYTVTYNIDSGFYSFDFPSVGYLGTVLNPTGFDGQDVDLITTNGVVYTGTGYLEAGELKFRLDNMWTTNWGGSSVPAPSPMVGTGAQNGSNILVTPAGNYDITFNRETLEYSITTASMSVGDFNALNMKAYPNPSTNFWNFSAGGDIIESILIVDMMGKIVMSATPKVNEVALDASGLHNGVYFAKVATANATQAIKVIKE